MAVLALVSAAMLSACGSDESQSTTASPTSSDMSQLQISRGQVIPLVGSATSGPSGKDVIPVAWRVAAVKKREVIEIVSESGYCVGSEPPPEFEGVRVSEKGNSVYITALIPRRSPSEDGVCRGAGHIQYGTVQIGRSVENTMLYDASTSPPSARRLPGRE